MWRLVLLAVGAFVAQTSEYLPIGVMAAIRDDLAVSESAVGGLVTGYAWLAALTAAPLTRLTANWDRKTLFLTLLGVIAIAGVNGAAAPGYGLLAASSVVMALAHGVFWAMLGVLAIRLAPHMPRTRVLAMVFAGISLAGVVGAPLSALVAQAAGWRWAFAGFALVAAGLAAAGILALPQTPSQRRGERPTPSFGNRRLRAVVPQPRSSWPGISAPIPTSYCCLNRRSARKRLSCRASCSFSARRERWAHSCRVGRACPPPIWQWSRRLASRSVRRHSALSENRSPLGLFSRFGEDQSPHSSSACRARP